MSHAPPCCGSSSEAAAIPGNIRKPSVVCPTQTNADPPHRRVNRRGGLFHRLFLLPEIQLRAAVVQAAHLLPALPLILQIQHSVDNAGPPAGHRHRGAPGIGDPAAAKGMLAGYGSKLVGRAYQVWFSRAMESISRSQCSVRTGRGAPRGKQAMTHSRSAPFSTWVRASSGKRQS